MRIRDLALKTCRRRWTIGKSGEKGSGISMLAARHDDNDDFKLWFKVFEDVLRNREVQWNQVISDRSSQNLLKLIKIVNFSKIRNPSVIDYDTWKQENLAINHHLKTYIGSRIMIGIICKVLRGPMLIHGTRCDLSSVITIYVLAGRSSLAHQCVEVHRRTSVISSSLFPQQCPSCLVHLIWMVFEMGGRWPYNCCFVGCCFQDLFCIPRRFLAQLLSGFFIRLVSVQVGLFQTIYIYIYIIPISGFFFTSFIFIPLYDI